MAQTMRVLRIWHAAVVTEYRKKIYHLAQFPGVQMHLLLPPQWREGGKIVVYERHEKIDSPFKVHVGRIVKGHNLRRFLFRDTLWGLMRNWRPEIIDIEEEPFAAVTGQVLLYRRLLRLRSHVIFHSAHNIEKPMEPLFERIQKWSLKSSSAAVVRNRETREILRAKGFDKPIVLSGNGIDLATFSPGPPGPLAKRLGLEGRAVIGFVGKLKNGKGVLTLLRAFRELDSRTVLLLVGDGHLREEILDTAKRFHLADRLRMVGAVSHEETPAYFRLMDIYVLPSETMYRWKESFGRTLVEAMACGVPVVGSSSGAIPDTIAGAGRIFPEGDAGALAAVLRELLRQPTLRQAMRTAGRRRAREFSWQNIAAKNYEAYLAATT